MLAGGVLAEERHQGFVSGSANTVGPVSATITGWNYDESGAGINGILAGTNTLLIFSRPVCGGIGTLGAIGNGITYSGMALTFGSFQIVHVTSFTNTTTTGITYPPAAPPKPTAFTATGTVGQLNYSLEDGRVNGFVFTPASGPKVFVGIGRPSAPLTAALTAGGTITASVTGMLEGPGVCAPTGTISEVDASSLMIGATTYPVSPNR
jgi:hypothetical protein